MNVKITFRGMHSTPVLEKHVHGQLKKIETFLSHEKQPVKIEVILEAHHIHAHHKAEIRISTPEYHILMAEEGPDIYRTIDTIIDRAYLALHEEKEKLVRRRKKGAPMPISSSLGENKEDDWEE